MATVYNFLNPDSTEIEEQRIISAPGATPGDVLTVAANGTVSPAPGGGSQAKQQCWSGNSVTVTAGSTGNPTFDYDDGGDDLLDISVPASPTFKEAGAYLVTAQVGCSEPLDAAGFLWIGLIATADVSPNPQTITMGTPFRNVDFSGVIVTFAVKVAAGSTLQVIVVNQDDISHSVDLSQSTVVKVA